MGRIEESQKNLLSAVDKMEDKLGTKIAKIDTEVVTMARVHHATKWVLIILLSLGGFFLAAVGYVAKEVWDLSKPLLMQKLTAPTPPVLGPTGKKL